MAKNQANPGSEIAKFVLASREKLGLTQEDFAYRYNCTKGNVSGWENGRHEPSYAVLDRLSFDSGVPLPSSAKPDHLGPAITVRDSPKLQMSSTPQTGGVSMGIFTSPQAPQSDKMDYTNVEEVAMPVNLVRAPVVGTARMGEDGHYEEIDYPVGHGDGWVDAYSADPNVYALRVKGDSMHPAIRHGSFVVVEPNGRCVPGEYVVLALVDGRKMVKELIIDRADEIVIESVNGNHRKTIDKIEIDKMHPVAAIVPASKWRSR